ncbi:MAG: Crp/Fnr family transcriptional regulator [Polyangiales bacterium]
MRFVAPLDLNVELRKIPLFAELPRHLFADVLARAHPRRIERDRPLVIEGEATTVPVLLQGLVKISLGRVLVDVRRGPSLPVASLTVDPTACPVTVTAMRPCDLAFVDPGPLLAAILATPSASQKLAELLARESRSYLKRLPELVGGSVEGRLMSLLDRLAERHGSPLDDGRYLPLPLRRCDLGMMVDATTETVSRTLAEWERRGWLRSNRSGLWWGSRRLRDSIVPAPPRPKSDRPGL